MAQRQIYEYPGELLWSNKSMDWYLNNDPNGLHNDMANTLLELRKMGLNIGDIASILNGAYQLAVTVAATENPKYSDITNNLLRLYPDDMAVLCGCVILLSQDNCDKYRDTVDELIKNVNDSNNKYGVTSKTYQPIKRKIIGLHNSGLQTDLSPDASIESGQTILWLIKNLRASELETVIRFHRTKESQLHFLNIIKANDFVKDELPF